MSSNNDQEKTEKPTPKKIADARKKGQVAISKEVPSVLILLAALGVFFFSGSWMLRHLAGYMKGILQNIGTFHLNEDFLYTFLADVSGEIIIILIPLMIGVLIAGIAGNIAQFGFLFTGEPLRPKFTKLNPLKGAKKLCSVKSIVELLKMLLKIIIIGGTAFIIVKREYKAIPSLIYMEVGEILSIIGKISFEICFYTSIVLILLAGLDFAYQKWHHEKDLRMTKQEIKEERKQQEGDPLLKARIKRTQIEIAKRRMMEAVPDADVIITNPTSLAIALKFDAKDMAAPKLIAKGAGFIAEKVKEIARENDIPVVEQKPLAQILYKSVEIGDYIPANFYRAVAEILAYVYRLKGKKIDV